MTPPSPLRGGRLVSALELALGIGIVVGHNVFRVVPNEVLILCALGLISMKLRGGGAASFGFVRPRSWRRILVIAIAAAALRIALGDLVIEPLTDQLWPPPASPEGIDEIRGNLGVAALALLLVWTFAAFGEELAYRGYLLSRAQDAMGGGSAAAWIAMVVAAIAFGVGHYYKGPAGIIDSGIAGLILGAAYLIAGRNLWACVLAHGLIDTIAVGLVYFGLDS